MIFEYLISFTIAFLISFTATPIARKIAFKIGAVDTPKDDRRMHNKPIARLGGLAILFGFLLAICFNIAGSTIHLNGLIINRQLLGLLLGVIIIGALGVVDDLKALSAKTKLVIQILAAIAVIFVSDIRIMSLTNPFSETGVSGLNIYLSYFLTIIWIVGVTNAINLIDGLDGLAAGVSSISALSLFFIAVINGDNYIAILTIILAGSALGFLPFNFNPAKIFMGDTGAMFLGFTLAVVSVQGTVTSYKSYAAISIAIPLIVLGLPLFDTSFAIIRRLITGKPIMQPDRGHLHHKLIDMGFSHKQSVVTMYMASASLGLCAIVLADKGVLSAMILMIATAIFIIGGARYMYEIEEHVEHKEEEKKETTYKIS